MMTQSLETILFYVNEGLHRVGIIPDDKYVTQEILLFSLIATIVTIPLVFRVIDYIVDNYKGYLLVITPVFSIIFLYMLGGYFPVLLLMITFGFVSIIYKYPQYRSIQEYMNRYF